MQDGRIEFTLAGNVADMSATRRPKCPLIFPEKAVAVTLDSQKGGPDTVFVCRFADTIQNPPHHATKE
jgi:hypothetical protein